MVRAGGTAFAFELFCLRLRRLRDCPENVEVFFDGGEVLVACRWGGFAVGGQGGGEGVGVGEFVAGAEFGGGATYRELRACLKALPSHGDA
jgi:hypothetical protein